MRCGVALLADAKAQSTQDLPIRVGVGVHVGEAVETDGSYIGSGGNIAARICAQARPGEVLVSETVRAALTRNVLPLSFVPRGRPQLKGIAERIPLYAVIEAPVNTKRLLRERRVVGVAGLGALMVAIAVLALGWAVSRPAPGLPAGDWKIGLVTTLSGFEEEDLFFAHVANAVELAVENLNSDGGIHGRPLGVLTLDDQLDEFLPRAHTETLVADPSVLAMIGPYASGQSIHALPISNDAGLFHCSPTNTDPALTKPRYGALDLRGADEERVSYIRIAPSDDIQSKALATFAFVDLNARDVVVIDDGVIGGQLADLFVRELEALGGTTVKRTLNEGADVRALLEPIFDGSDQPDAVFFSGMTSTGGPEVRQVMDELGHRDKPLLAWDAMFGGSGADEGSYIEVVGAELAEGTYASQAALPDAKFAFVDAYRERFDIEPEQWAAGAYACMEIIFESLRAVAFSDMTAAQLREEVRRYAVDVERRYETVVGNIAFDENGDNVRQFVAIYRVDTSAAGGLGDWVLVKKQDYGPPP